MYTVKYIDLKNSGTLRGYDNTLNYMKTEFFVMYEDAALRAQELCEVIRSHVLNVFPTIDGLYSATSDLTVSFSSGIQDYYEIINASEILVELIEQDNEEEVQIFEPLRKMINTKFENINHDIEDGLSYLGSLPIPDSDGSGA